MPSNVSRMQNAVNTLIAENEPHIRGVLQIIVIELQIRCGYH